MRTVGLGVLCSLLLASCVIAPATSRGPAPPPPPPGQPAMETYIEGRVVDAATGAPIGRAALDYTGPVAGTANSDESGYFRTPALPPGEYNLRARRENYATMSQRAQLIQGPQRIEIAMRRQ